MNEPVIQVYIYKGKKFVIRSATKNAHNPSEAQREVREVFGEIARLGKGKKMDGELPPSAELVKEKMKGYRSKSGRKHRKKVWERELEDYVKERYKEKSDEVIRRLIHG